MQARMSEREFQRWQRFYLQQPFDDVHRYYRPAALQAAAFGGGNIGEMMDFLVNKAEKPPETDADLSVFAAFGVPPPEQFKK